MNKDYFIVIDGEKVPVSEEVYRAFKRPAWAERKRRQVRADHELSLEAFAGDGFDIPSGDPLVDEIVADKLLLNMLFPLCAERGPGHHDGAGQYHQSGRCFRPAENHGVRHRQSDFDGGRQANKGQYPFREPDA